MKLKGILAILLVLVMTLGVLASCGKTEGNTDTKDAAESQDAGQELAGEYPIKVWVAEAAVELTKAQIEKFNETNEDGNKFVPTVESVSEADAGTNMVTDVEAGGDILARHDGLHADFIMLQFLNYLATAALPLGKGLHAGRTVGKKEGVGKGFQGLRMGNVGEWGQHVGSRVFYRKTYGKRLLGTCRKAIKGAAKKE